MSKTTSTPADSPAAKRKDWGRAKATTANTPAKNMSAGGVHAQPPTASRRPRPPAGSKLTGKRKPRLRSRQTYQPATPANGANSVNANGYANEYTPYFSMTVPQARQVHLAGSEKNRSKTGGKSVSTLFNTKYSS